MRPVNLLPVDVRARAAGEGDPRVAYGVVGGLALLLVMVLVAVLYSNQATTLRDEAAALQAEAQRLSVTVKPVQSFNDFADVVHKRTLLVGGLAESRFPWDTALQNLSKSMPDDITLDSITTQIGAGTGATGNANAASMDLTGCASNWIGISRFVVRMRAMPGVQDVKVTNSSESTGQSGGSSSGQSGGSSSGTGAGTVTADAKRKKNCGLEPLAFSLNVIYVQQKVDLIGLPKIDSGSGGGATGAVATPASASTPQGSGG